MMESSFLYQLKVLKNWAFVRYALTLTFWPWPLTLVYEETTGFMQLFPTALCDNSSIALYSIMLEHDSYEIWSAFWLWSDAT